MAKTKSWTRPGAPLAAALAAFLALAACESPEERVERHYQRGLELVEAGDDERARLEFRNALKIREDHAPSLRAFAETQERAGDIGGATRRWRAAAEADETDPEARIRLAQILALGGALDEAEAFAESALALAPENPDALAARGAIALRRDDVEGAIADAQAALEQEPGHLDAEIVLVSERARAGASEEALARVEALLEASPEERTLHLLKLRLLSHMGEEAAVAAQLERMASLFPDEPAFGRALAQNRIEAGDAAGAEAALRALAEREPNVETAADLVRLVYRNRGFEAALAELDALADAATDAVEAARLRQARAQLELEAGRPEEAKRTLRALAAEEGEGALNARAALARLLRAEGARDEAMALVAEVLEEDSENVEALALRADEAISEDRIEDALADLRLALDADPQNPRLMVLEARAHERDGNMALVSERLAAATRAAEYDPATAQIYVRHLLGRGEARAAESVLEEVVRRDPRNRDALAQLAETRLRLEDWSGVEQAAQALRQVAGGEALADRIVAAALSGQGRLGESIAALEGLVDDDDAARAARAALVANYVRAGEVDRAVAFVETALEQDPDDIAARLLRAELHLLQDEAETALALVEETVRQAPERPGVHLALARLLIRLDRFEQAEQAVRAGIEAVGETQGLGLTLAQLQERRGDFDAAIETYARLAEADPDSVLYANNLASLIAEHRADDPESLERAARVARRLRGYDLPHLQDTYGWVTFLQGDEEAALRSLLPAAEALPDNPLVRYHLGRVYAAVDRPELAREHLEAALALDPDFAKAASARETLAALPAAAAPAQGQ